ncbi:MAG: hypothetical protein AB1758_33865, partial [Candidatus Eremiobacterota bacterium]
MPPTFPEPDLNAPAALALADLERLGWKIRIYVDVGRKERDVRTVSAPEAAAYFQAPGQPGVAYLSDPDGKEHPAKGSEWLCALSFFRGGGGEDLLARPEVGLELLRLERLGIQVVAGHVELPRGALGAYLSLHVGKPLEVRDGPAVLGTGGAEMLEKARYEADQKAAFENGTVGRAVRSLAERGWTFRTVLPGRSPHEDTRPLTAYRALRDGASIQVAPPHGDLQRVPSESRLEALAAFQTGDQRAVLLEELEGRGMAISGVRADGRLDSGVLEAYRALSEGREVELAVDGVPVRSRSLAEASRRADALLADRAAFLEGRLEDLEHPRLAGSLSALAGDGWTFGQSTPWRAYRAMLDGSHELKLAQGQRTETAESSDDLAAILHFAGKAAVALERPELASRIQGLADYQFYSSEFDPLSPWKAYRALRQGEPVQLAIYGDLVRDVSADNLEAAVGRLEEAVGHYRELWQPAEAEGLLHKGILPDIRGTLSEGPDGAGFEERAQAFLSLARGLKAHPSTSGRSSPTRGFDAMRLYRELIKSPGAWAARQELAAAVATDGPEVLPGAIAYAERLLDTPFEAARQERLAALAAASGATWSQTERVCDLLRQRPHDEPLSERLEALSELKPVSGDLATDLEALVLSRDPGRPLLEQAREYASLLRLDRDAAADSWRFLQDG